MDVNCKNLDIIIIEKKSMDVNWMTCIPLKPFCND